MFGDLHVHTKLSDGSLGMDDVIFYAKRSGMDFLSLTDHDTMAATTRAVVMGNRIGIHIIPGVELSCSDHQRNNRKVHLLCYLPQIPQRLEGFCSHTLERRNQAGQQMLKNVMKYYPVTPSHLTRYVAGSKALYKQHIMQALMDLGYTDRIFGELFDQLFDRHNGICRVEMEYADIREAAQLAKSAGGVVVLAHPSQYQSIDLLEELAQAGLLHGVELYHKANPPEEMDAIREIGEKYHLIFTGGSDFHGSYTKTPMPLGSFITPEESINALYKVSGSMKKR